MYSFSSSMDWIFDKSSIINWRSSFSANSLISSPCVGTSLTSCYTASFETATIFVTIIPQIHDNSYACVAFKLLTDLLSFIRISLCEYMLTAYNINNIFIPFLEAYD